MMAEDDIPVSDAMIDEAISTHIGGLTRSAFADIYRAMERVRRAEADAEVIRRSVKG
jgi:hypothetical protein